MHSVVTGNSVGCVHHKLGEGTIRTSRVRYVCDGGALYIPAWPGVESWYAARLPALECHISELDWNSCWRCVRLRGQVTPLHSTGAPREREAWREGITALRRAVTDLAPMEDLALANFGIVQIDIEFWEGTVVLWDEAPASNSMYSPTLQVADSQPLSESSLSEPQLLVQPTVELQAKASAVSERRYDEPARSSWTSWQPKIPDLLMAMILFANEIMSVNANLFNQVALTAGTGT